jgi:2Fe-2S ferredoxin
MKIIVTDLDGQDHEIEGVVNWSIMKIIRGSGLLIRAECGGACTCATCHVYVDPEWLDKIEPRGEDEQDILYSAMDVRPNSRLSCQFTLRPDLEGLRVTLSVDAAG